MRPLRNTERVLANPAVEKIIELERELGNNIKFDDIAEGVVGVYPKVMVEGDLNAGAWSCGLVAGLINDVPSCDELISGIMKDAHSMISERLSGLI